MRPESDPPQQSSTEGIEPPRDDSVSVRVVSVADTLAPATATVIRWKGLRRGTGWAALTALAFVAAYQGWASLLSRGEGFGRWLATLTAPAAGEPTPALASPMDSLEAVTSESEEEGKSPATSGQPRARAVARPAFAGSLSVSAETVLRLANAGYVPKGHEVPEGLGRPAGVQLDNVSVLGLGVSDGDVVVGVNGIATPTAADAVSAVLSARARRAHAIGVRLWRGGTLHLVRVEMPYVDSRGALIDPSELGK